MPPFSPSTCASAASHNGIRRPIGKTNLPSRTSSANSRTLDGSGRAALVDLRDQLRCDLTADGVRNYSGPHR
jgi:hypothetical protein